MIPNPDCNHCHAVARLTRAARVNFLLAALYLAPGPQRSIKAAAELLGEGVRLIERRQEAMGQRCVGGGR